MKRFMFSGVMFFGVTGCATMPPDSPVGLDENFFKNAVVITEDIGNSVIFSTINGFQRRQGEQGTVWDDNFLRGFIDKRTGAKIFQVYNVIYYGGSGTQSGWKHFAQASYLTAEGVRRLTPTNSITEHEDCAPLAVYGSCVYSEQVVFKVDEIFLKTVADSYALDSKIQWPYQLIPTNGNSYEDSMAAAEVAGLLSRMEDYQKQFSITSVGKPDNESSNIILLPEPLIVSPPATAKPPL
ncbi:MAG: hypothetical protein BWK79_08795 [Beggiatoa sp. IS2]|nr:MAG: hypothetical protein BWK79_08795 [Beggiatoa sp. IS2]